MRNEFLTALTCAITLCNTATIANACSVCQATCPASMTCPTGYTPVVISETCEQRFTTYQGVQFPDGCKAGGTVKCKCTNALGAHSGASEAGSCNAVGIPCPPLPKDSLSVRDPIFCNQDLH